MKKWTFIFVLFGLLSGLHAIAQTKAETKAAKLLAKYDVPGAIDRYERMAEKGNPQAMEQLGRIYLKLRNYSAAMDWYGKAIRVVRESNLTDDGLYDFASLLQTIGEVDSAYSVFEQHAARRTSDPRSQKFASFLRNLPGMAIDSQFYSIERMLFNSKYSDFGPIPYRDGLVFCSERPNAVGGVTYISSTSHTPLLNLYYTKAKDSTFERFGTPRSIDWGLSTRFHEGPIALNADTSVIYFTRTGMAGKGEEALVKIYRAKRDGNRWGKAEILKITGFENASYGYPAISPGGKYLYFAGKRGGQAGNWDLYRVKTGGRNIKAEELGPKINTEGNETMPFIHSDGSLYFSSDGHPGFGGMDLFYAVMRDNSWGTPINLDRPINSSYDDFSCWITPDKSNGFFASNRDSKNRNDDIYRFTKRRPEFTECVNQVEDSYCYRFYDENAQNELPVKCFFEWDMGDGTVIRDLKVQHCFPGPGSYVVSLNIVDSMSNEEIFNYLAYEVELERTEQAYITVADTHEVGIPVDLHAFDCHLPKINIRDYYWDFGDGDMKIGVEVDHLYTRPGKYTIQLGVIGEEKNTGKPVRFCVLKDIQIVPPGTIKLDGSPLKDRANKDSPDSMTTKFNSSEMDSANYRVQLGTSLSKLTLDPMNFRGLEGVVEVIEAQYFRYFYGESTTIDSAIVSLREMQGIGYDNATILSFNGDSLPPGQPFKENWLPGEDFDFSTVRGHVQLVDSNDLGRLTKIVWEDLGTGEKIFETVIDPATGDFVQNLPKGKYYGYSTDINTYFPVSRDLDLGESSPELVIDDTIRLLSLQEILNDNIPIRINNIFFDFDKSILKPESFSEINRVAKFLTDNPGLRVEIAGYTDDQGSEVYNQKLSQRRAAEVRRQLILANCGAYSIIAKGYGEMQPLASNKDEEGRKINRRVEFRILGGNKP